MLENILLLFPLIILGGIIYYYNRKIKLLKKSFEVERELIKIDTKKRSGAVQWGKTIEHFVPFIENFPVPAEDCTFLGMPIDYVAFCLQTLYSAKNLFASSFLMSKQKNIKKAIQEGRVFWHEVSVGGNNIE